MTDVPRIAVELGLVGEEGSFGPSDFLALAPSPEADDLGRLIARRALAPLGAAVEAGEVPHELDVGDVDEGRSMKAEVPAEPNFDDVSQLGYTLGLPLVTAIWPSVPVLAGFELIPRRLAPPEHLRGRHLVRAAPDDHYRRLRAEEHFQLVLREAKLWDVAGRHGGPAVMPFAVRIRALRWWWEPRRGRKRRPTICVRCGSIMFTAARRSRLPAPFCKHCVKNRALEHDRAIAPAGRGRWWLRCESAGCTFAFEAPAQAHFCSDHRAAALTPSRRASRDLLRW